MMFFSDGCAAPISAALSSSSNPTVPFAKVCARSAPDALRTTTILSNLQYFLFYYGCFWVRYPAKKLLKKIIKKKILMKHRAIAMNECCVVLTRTFLVQHCFKCLYFWAVWSLPRVGLALALVTTYPPTVMPRATAASRPRCFRLVAPSFDIS